MLVRNKHIPVSSVTSFSIRTYSVRATWKIDNENLDSAKKKFNKLLEDNKSHPALQNVDFSTKWEPNSADKAHLTFNVEKAGSSSILFQIQEHSKPTEHITISEISRSISLFHRPFESSLDNGIEMVFNNIGAQKKE